MKHTTRILALLLALVLCLGLSVTAFATEGAQVPTGDGSITINSAVKDQTYTIYRILELESYNATPGQEAYSYKVTRAWKNFITGTGIKDVYVKVDDQEYVTWVTDADPAAFAKAALAYARDTTNGITDDGNTMATSTTVTFNSLPLGYYLVDSTVGTLCALGTTNSSVTVEDKHTAPTIDKQVWGNSTENDDKVNDVSIGDTMNFKVTIDAKKGAQNYVFHDTMSDGLTFKTGSVEVKKGDKFSSAKLATATTDYTVKTPGNDGCTFEVAFTDTFCNGLTDSDYIYITYSATLNANAEVGNNGNANKGVLKYGEKNDLTTAESTTKTYTWAFDVLKYGNGQETKVLQGAEFVVLSQDKQKVAKVVNGKMTGWENVPTGEPVTWPAGTVLTTNDHGKIDVAGLDAGTYHLREVKAPDGYNKLKGEQEFTIKREKNDTDSTMSYIKTTVKVNNLSGTILPSTGGMGTTIFYVLGGILAVGAAVLLVTKKRMERI